VLHSVSTAPFMIGGWSKRAGRHLPSLRLDECLNESCCVDSMVAVTNVVRDGATSWQSMGDPACDGARIPIKKTHPDPGA
jgi:hypothetical protein